MRLSTTSAVCSLAVLASLLAAPVHAAPILGSAGAGHQNAGLPMENSRRFWDGNSWDSESRMDGASNNPCNAGSLANGIACNLNPAAVGAATRAGLPGSSFTLANGQAGFAAWGNDDGSADLNYGFGAEGGMLYDFSMLGEFTDDWAVNEIGWYALDNPRVLHSIFNADAAVGSTSQVFIGSNFGFYYRNTMDAGEVFYTQSMFNTQGRKQQFAVFQRDDYTILGVEDIFSTSLTRTWTPTGADYDHNDVMFGFRRANVPEPGSLLLLGMGIAGAFAARRRKTSSR